MQTTEAHPFLQTDCAVRWSALTPEHVVPDITAALKTARGRIEKIGAQAADTLSYENSFGAFEAALEPLNTAWNYVGHLDSVANSPELRKAHNEMLPLVSEFHSRLYVDKALWNVLKTFAQSAPAQTLDQARARFVSEVSADFRENGADLPEDKRARLVEIDAELAQLTQKFSENVLDATNAFSLVVEDEAQLEGLPASAVEAAALDAKQHNAPGWRFTLHEPVLHPVLQYADNEPLRRTLWEAFNAVGREQPYDNKPLVPRILELRDEKARLLGFDNFSDYVLSRRMAKTGKRALDFIEDLHTRVEKKFKEECAELETFKAETLNSTPEPLEPWELSYWAEKLRKARTDFDGEQLRPYFEVSRVIHGLFTLSQKLFGISITENKSVERWHESVKACDVFDSDSGEKIGLFYADWHPRVTKRSGAWMNPLKDTPQIGCVCGNMTAPTAEKPALLTHEEATVVFHEFGHLLHHLLGKVPVKSLNGTNVAWDFVELPSQIMENWCWEPEALKLFARHWQTNEPLPQAFLEKMLKAKNFRSASFAMRQLSFGKLDLEMHLNAAVRQGDLEANLKAALKNYTAPLKRDTPTILYHFNHLFSGPVAYASGYYSYKWAEVLEADAFTRFQKEGILNPETGKAFRDTILSQGNLQDPETLFQNFLHRPPNPNALLKREGLLGEEGR